jgi:cation:H+ antiporter
VGNVVGSNIFNFLLCLGSAGLAGSITASPRASAFDLGALAVMTLFVAMFIRTERTISRREGGVVLVLYFAFAAITIARG